MKTKLELYQDIHFHLLNDDVPSNYLNSIHDQTIFHEYPFQMLHKLKETNQSPIHHPEGSVWNHTMLVVDMAAKVKHQSHNPSVFMWAALLHDIGKPDTTRIRKGKITSYDHEKKGYELAKEFLSVFTNDSNFINEIAVLVRWHMQVLFVVNNLPFAEVEKMKQQVDINEVALLGFCDRLGRLHVDQKKEELNMKQFIEKCQSLSVK